MISDPTPELGRPAPVPTYQPTAADWQHIYAQVPSGIQNNHPAQFYNNLLRNAQSVSNVNEVIWFIYLLLGLLYTKLK